MVLNVRECSNVCLYAATLFMNRHKVQATNTLLILKCRLPSLGKELHHTPGCIRGSNERHNYLKKSNSTIMYIEVCAPLNLD